MSHFSKSTNVLAVKAPKIAKKSGHRIKSEPALTELEVQPGHEEVLNEKLVAHLIKYLDFNTLISAMETCKTWWKLGVPVIQEHLKGSKFTLLLQQECRLKHTVEFHFEMIDPSSGQVIFMASNPSPRRYYHGSPQPDVTDFTFIQQSTQTILTTKSYFTDTKRGGIKGTSHPLDGKRPTVPKSWEFFYRVVEDGKERWIYPVTFQCDLCFLSTPEPASPTTVDRITNWIRRIPSNQQIHRKNSTKSLIRRKTLSAA
ncbi:hypothetical protein K493DRAFT_88587 [Basidiobolus meristosporus CBS 931.73]|uniref:F-box domain-containing protein n=1 Tax=Basidiobolus meristosporus CBS 931.73 TaxID=1314790 RepID=A0A1Y1YV55_9FUNG|nr:hypothetical protein K493DRAFT_88587 [Basidiobolus meristosporus CBS 931.73]|eukprot:ORY01923.1 hypothetical protein K493DRAFT_88587 [Basidiobolus meristosporus CBS 931.73]